MAPTTVAPKTGPITQPSSPVSEVGKAAAFEQTAHKDFATIRAELKGVHEALKKDPSNPKLKAQETALGHKGAAAFAKWQTAKETLEAAVTKAAGGGKAADQAGRLSQQLPQAQRDLASAERMLLVQSERLRKANAAPASPRKSTEVAALNRTVDGLVAKRDALAATVKGLENGILARQGTALTESKAAKKLGAADQADVLDVASRSRDEQVRLTGAPVQNISGRDAAKLDAARIAEAAKVSPENGVKMLQMQLRGSDVDQQSRLIEAAGPEIAKLVKAAETNPKLTEALLDTLKQTSGYARTDLAKKMVAGVTHAYAPVLTAAMQRLTSGDGTVEAQALKEALGPAQAGIAAPLDSILSAKVTAVQEEFVSKAKDVQKLNTDLARLVVGFGPMMSDAQKQSAIEAFKAEHKDEYAAYEAAGAKLAPMAQYAIESGSDRLQSLIPEFLNTKAGEKAVMEGLAAQQENKPGLLDAFKTRASMGADGVKIATAVSTAMAKGVGMRSLELARAGRIGDAEKLIGSLNNNARLFGLEPKAMAGITEKMAGVVKSGGATNAVNALKQEFKNLETSPAGFTGHGANVMKGLGIGLSAVAVIDGIANWDDAAAIAKVKTVTDGISVGVDGGLLAMEITGKLNPLSKGVHLARRASAVAGAVGAVMDGISAYESFKKGEHAEGLATSASAVGGAILATYAFAAAAGVQALPVAGQIIGAVLVIGGTIAKWTIEERKAQKKETALEDDAEAFLKAAYPSLPADKLGALADIKRDDGRNVGMVVKDLAPLLGITPKALMDHLTTLSETQIRAFLAHTKDVAVGREGKFNTTGDHGLSVTANWMAQDGLLNGPDGKLLKGVKLPPER